MSGIKPASDILLQTQLFHGDAGGGPNVADRRKTLQAVPVMRPRLPNSELLLPYLRQMDANRIYSNHGPLMVELERKLSHFLLLSPNSIACASSGTAALIGAILG